MSDLNTAVTALLETFEKNWNALNPSANKALWDTDEPEPYYIAEEIEDTIYGWDALDRYWDSADSVIERFAIETSEVHAKHLSDDFAALNFLMHWDLEFKGWDKTPIGFDVKVSLILRRKGEEWKICHYVESPLGPLPYIKKMYASQVRDSFKSA